MTPRPKVWKSGWLVTWEARSERYLQQLGRPRVVCVLPPQLSSSTVGTILCALYLSESRLTMGEKLHSSLSRPGFKRWVRQERHWIDCGRNPWLRARLVENLSTDEDAAGVETLHYLTPPAYATDAETKRLAQVRPERMESIRDG